MKHTVLAVSIAALFAAPAYATQGSNHHNTDNSVDASSTNVNANTNANANTNTQGQGQLQGQLQGQQQGQVGIVSNTSNPVSNSQGGNASSSASGGNASASNGNQVLSNRIEAPDLGDRVPDLHVGGLTTGDCMGSASGSVVAAGFGIGGGKTVIDDDCNARRNAIIMQELGFTAVAVEVLCDIEDIRNADSRANTGLCQSDDVVLESGTIGVREEYASVDHVSSRK